MSNKTIRLSIYTLAAAAALTAAAAVPAFAWGAGGPITSYDQSAQGSSFNSGYYDYAPGVVTSQAHKKHHLAR
ncbi:MAG: hypothetical protein WA776_08715 [Xanthobacteraceae bacterium]